MSAPQLPNADDVRVRAMLQFAAEEAKHIQLFKRFHDTFTAGFGHECEVIGPPEAMADDGAVATSRSASRCSS